MRVLQFDPGRLLRQELHFQTGLTVQTPNLLSVCGLQICRVSLGIENQALRPELSPLSQSDTSWAVTCAEPRMDQWVQNGFYPSSKWGKNTLQQSQQLIPYRQWIIPGKLLFLVVCSLPFQSTGEPEHPSALGIPCHVVWDTAELMHKSCLWNNSEKKQIWLEAVVGAPVPFLCPIPGGIHP